MFFRAFFESQLKTRAAFVARFEPCWSAVHYRRGVAFDTRLAATNDIDRVVRYVADKY